MIMKRTLNRKELLLVASMLFGLFFGAGNLIFPVYMGQQAGRNLLPAALGFLVTGVGLPLLGVAALGSSRKDGVLEMSSQVGKGWGIVFTSLLYLTIGPFFAIPRCATVSFTVGLESLLPAGSHGIWLAAFSLLFFLAVLFFSLRPGKILTWVGKILNPLFLCFLGILMIRAVISPMGAIGEAEPLGNYQSAVFFQGFLEGYNTMDALAGLAFGIIVVNVIRGLGVEDADAVAKNTVKAGVFSSLLMAGIYVLVAGEGGTSGDGDCYQWLCVPGLYRAEGNFHARSYHHRRQCICGLQCDGESGTPVRAYDNPEQCLQELYIPEKADASRSTFNDKIQCVPGLYRPGRGGGSRRHYHHRRACVL